MSDAELENEASKWKIREYGNSNGSISRKIIIEQLIAKDQANNSRIAIFVSLVALIISILTIIYK
ncbi:MAG: hypothetical protein WC924_05850 [Candidatus Gracilibacteria bacterium]